MLSGMQNLEYCQDKEVARSIRSLIRGLPIQHRHPERHRQGGQVILERALPLMWNQRHPAERPQSDLVYGVTWNTRIFLKTAVDAWQGGHTEIA